MKSGFAGSLVVSAGWKGRNLRRGMQDSQKRVRNFGKGIRRIVAVTALGVGAFAAGKGLRSLMMMSSVGAKAISAWSMAWAQFKTQVSRLVSGPAAKVIGWLSGGLAILTEWLKRQRSILSVVITVGVGFRNLYTTLVKLGKSLAQLVSSLTKSAMMVIFQKVLDISIAIHRVWSTPIKTLLLDTGIFQKILDLTIKIAGYWRSIVDWIRTAVSGAPGQIRGGIFGSRPGPNVQRAAVSLMEIQPQPAGGI